MTAPAFGRRAAPRAAAAPVSPTEALGAKARAFRSELAAERGASSDSFEAWRRRQRCHRAVAWLASVALMVPGFIFVGVEAPVWVSAVVEAAGIAAGFWLRAARRRHLRAIAAWNGGEGG